MDNNSILTNFNIPQAGIFEFQPIQKLRGTDEVISQIFNETIELTNIEHCKSVRDELLTTKIQIKQTIKEINDLISSNNEDYSRVTQLGDQIFSLNKKLEKYKPESKNRPVIHKLLDLLFGLGKLLSLYKEYKVNKDIEKCEKIRSQYKIRTEETLSEIRDLAFKLKNLRTKDVNFDIITNEIVELEKTIAKADSGDRILSANIAYKLSSLTKSAFELTIGKEIISSEDIFKDKSIEDISKTVSDALERPEITSLTGNKDICETALKGIENIEDIKNIKDSDVITALKTVLCWNKILKSIESELEDPSKLDTYYIVSLLGRADRINPNGQFLQDLALNNIDQIAPTNEATITKELDGTIHVQSHFSLSRETKSENHTIDINIQKKTYEIFKKAINPQ